MIVNECVVELERVLPGGRCSLILDLSTQKYNEHNYYLAEFSGPTFGSIFQMRPAQGKPNVPNGVTAHTTMLGWLNSH